MYLLRIGWSNMLSVKGMPLGSRHLEQDFAMTRFSTADFTRRAALGMLGAMPVLAHAQVMDRPTPITKGLRFDPADPKNHVATCLRMRASLDGRMRAGFALGQYYGVVDDKLTYLFDVLAGAFYASRPRGDGSFDQRSFEVAYMVDPQTQQPLDYFANPYTGKSVAVPRTKLGPSNALLTKDARIIAPNFPPGATQDSAYATPIVVGNDVWVRQHAFVKFPAPPGGRSFSYSEFTLAHAHLSDLADPATPNVPTTTTTNIVTSWRPWLEMGDAPGHMMLVGGVGHMSNGLDGMPANYVALGHKLYPEIFADPAAYLTKGW